MSTESNYSETPQKADCNPRLVSPLRPPIHSTVHRNYWERSLYPHPKVPSAIKDGRLMTDAGWMRVERNGEVTGFVSDGIEWSTVSLEENAAAKSRANAQAVPNGERDAPPTR